MKINKIKLICEACWLTQRELSACTGIKEQRLKDISIGRVDGFKSDDIALLVEKLHLNPEWLIAGEGEIFKQGYGRSFPSKGEFVSEILMRMVKLIDPIQYQPVIDNVLGLENGTAMKWIKKAQIPYWYLKKFADENAISIDMLIYGHCENAAYKYQEPIKRIAQQEPITYNQLSKRELALLDDFRALSDKEKDAAETMLNAVAKQRVKKQV